MSEERYEPRLFPDDAAVRRVGEGMLACAIAKEEWTHEAHLATCLWLIVERPDICPEREIGGFIRRFNESVGGVNDETQGYHETITQCFVAGVRGCLGRMDPALPLVVKVNLLLGEPEGRRDWPLRFYSAERLFSVEARMGFVEPDLAPITSLVIPAKAGISIS